jgi:hypothetical protein
VVAALRWPKPQRVKFEPRYVNGRVAVLDTNGNIVWRVRVAKNEMTCLDCGETTTRGFCTRCVVEDDEMGASGHSKLGRNLVPTLSYLREGEYECV